MRIWMDVLTPKQVLFFEPLIKRLKTRGHKVFVTTRNFRETIGVMKHQKLKFLVVGKYGGGSLSGKVNAENQRNRLLLPLILKFKPQLSIGSASPNLSRLSFALDIPFYLHSNTPHADKTMRLSVPLCKKLFIPRHIPSQIFHKFGITNKQIFTYNAMDENIMIKMNPGPINSRTLCVIRSSETQASYFKREINLRELCVRLHEYYPKEDIMILPRYQEEIKPMKIELRNHATIIDEPVDSSVLLSKTDLFIGSGGTMTSEAVLRGVKTISMNLTPNMDENHLVSLGLLKRAQTVHNIMKAIDLGWSTNYKKRAKIFGSLMEDPFDIMIKEMKL